MSADSIIDNRQESLSNNTYIYCRNNPIILFDPFGNSWLFGLLLIVCAAVLTGCSDNSNNGNIIRSFNCYAYSVGRKTWMHPGGKKRIQKYTKKGNSYKVHKDYFDVTSMANDVIMDLGGDNNARLVAGVTSNVPDGWHMIALCTGYVCDDDGYVNIGPYSTKGDFHFMWCDNGIWTHKRGQGPIESLEAGMTPDSEGAWPEMYTSQVIYMIVRDDW